MVIKGHKGSQGQKGMPGTCDTKVIVLKHFFSDFHSLQSLCINNPFTKAIFIQLL